MDLKLFCLFAIIAVAFSRPLAPGAERGSDKEDEGQARIINFEYIPNSGDGSYKFSYETSNGLHREEEGVVKIGRNNTQYIHVTGRYVYHSDEGRITVEYEADEDGYRETKDIEEPVGLPAGALGSLIGGGLG